MRGKLLSLSKHHNKTPHNMTTYVLPLPGSTAIANHRYSLDNVDDLIDHIDSNEQVKQMLSIECSFGYGVYRDTFQDYYVVADIQWSWEDVLGYSNISSDHKPSEQDWKALHQYTRERLANVLTGALGRTISPNSFVYRIRRNGPRAKVFKIIPTF